MVESFNSTTRHHKGTLQRGLIRTMGFNKTELLLAIYLAAVNTRIIRDFYTQHPDLTDETDSKACVPKPVIRRQPATSLGTGYSH